jgi:1-deoxy-D-xylulose-5-phosphate synthase
MLVVLNENQMSISPNVGAMTKVLARMMSGPTVTNIREHGKQLMHKDSRVWRFMSRWEEHVKGMIVPSTLFEEFGFNYLGPIDGHDVPLLVRTLQTIQTVDGPNLLHVITAKGKGYEPAEKDPVKYHAVAPFDPEKGIVPASPAVKPKQTYTQVFSQWLCDMAERDDSLLAITPAMREGSGLVEFEQRFPTRYFDVSIAEQHAVTLAAGMACEGTHPVVAIYSTFLQRAYDQLIHDVALQNLPVLFAIDRAGLVGSDGPTHAGNFDLSFLRCVPNMVVMAPANENECRQMLFTGFSYQGPAAVRYPRGAGPGEAVEPEMRALAIGKAEVVKHGKDVVMLSFGSCLEDCRTVASRIGASLVNMRFVKPLDADLVMEMANSHKLVVTIEENAVMGGAGSGVNELLAASGGNFNILNIGIPDTYIEHGSRQDCLAWAGLDADGIFKQVNTRLELMSGTQSVSGSDI